MTSETPMGTECQREAERRFAVAAEHEDSEQRGMAYAFAMVAESFRTGCSLTSQLAAYDRTLSALSTQQNLTDD